jgi:hypothetical protein
LGPFMTRILVTLYRFSRLRWVRGRSSGASY